MKGNRLQIQKHLEELKDLKRCPFNVCAFYQRILWKNIVHVDHWRTKKIQQFWSISQGWWFSTSLWLTYPIKRLKTIWNQLCLLTVISEFRTWFASSICAIGLYWCSKTTKTISESQTVTLDGIFFYYNKYWYCVLSINSSTDSYQPLSQHSACS